MRLVALAYVFLFSSLCGGDWAFAVCNAGDCKPKTEKAFDQNLTIAVSNDQLADISFTISNAVCNMINSSQFNYYTNGGELVCNYGGLPSSHR